MTDRTMAVYFDYVCPYCLLAEDIVTEVAQEHDIDVEWRAFELRPYPTPTLRPEEAYLSTIWPRSVYPLARRLNVPIKLPSISPQPYSHTAFEGMVYARRHGKQDAYNSRVLRAFFQEDKDIGDLDVLTQIAGDLGLDKADFQAALTERRHAEEHQAALAQARADNITSVPTVLFNGQRLLGTPSREQLTQFIRSALTENAQDTR